jgi:transposase
MSEAASEMIQIPAQELASLRQRLQWAELKVQALEERLRLERVRKYGPGSETLSSRQLELLEGEPGVCREEVQAEAAREPLPAAAAPARERKTHPGRQALPENLPRVVREIACAPEACVCGRCGAERTVVGYDDSEQLEVEPAKYFVVVTRREKRACPRCAEGIQAAPLPARIVDKSLVSDRIIVNTVIAKYADHLPLYRQSEMLEREAGFRIHRATMDGWVMQVGELLQPVALAQRKELLTGPYIQADETPVGVQVREGTGQNHQGYLWQYGRPGGPVVFDFQMGRGREGPQTFLGEFAGLLQTDGYTVYDRVGGRGIVHAGCLAHARRKAVEALKVSPEDADAARLVARMNAVFAVDAEARALGLAVEQRHELRLRKSAALMEELRVDLLALAQGRGRQMPASALSKAVHYTLAQWTKLARFLEHPLLELSNNWAENAMRPVALGRKNWVHIGSEAAGPKVAAILSVMETCRRLGVPARDYLAEILPGMARLTVQQAAERTPGAWLARQKAAASSRT